MITASYTMKIEAAAKALFEAEQQRVEEAQRLTWDTISDNARRALMRQANQAANKNNGPSKIVKIQ